MSLWDFVYGNYSFKSMEWYFKGVKYWRLILWIYYIQENLKHFIKYENSNWNHLALFCKIAIHGGYLKHDSFHILL